MAEKGLAYPPNWGFANLFQAGRAGLTADFGWQFRQISTLPTFFRLAGVD